MSPLLTARPSVSVTLRLVGACVVTALAAAIVAIAGHGEPLERRRRRPASPWAACAPRWWPTCSTPRGRRPTTAAWPGCRAGVTVGVRRARHEPRSRAGALPRRRRSSARAAMRRATRYLILALGAGRGRRLGDRGRLSPPAIAPHSSAAWVSSSSPGPPSTRAPSAACPPPTGSASAPRYRARRCSSLAQIAVAVAVVAARERRAVLGRDVRARRRWRWARSTCWPTCPRRETFAGAWWASLALRAGQFAVPAVGLLIGFIAVAEKLREFEEELDPEPHGRARARRAPAGAGLARPAPARPRARAHAAADRRRGAERGVPADRRPGQRPGGRRRGAGPLQGPGRRGHPHRALLPRRPRGRHGRRARAGRDPARAGQPRAPARRAATSRSTSPPACSSTRTSCWRSPGATSRARSWSS